MINSVSVINQIWQITISFVTSYKKIFHPGGMSPKQAAEESITRISTKYPNSLRGAVIAASKSEIFYYIVNYIEVPYIKYRTYYFKSVWKYWAVLTLIVQCTRVY